MKLTIDQIFPRKRFSTRKQPPKMYPVPNYSDTENMWEFLCQIGIAKAPSSLKTTTTSLYKTIGKFLTVTNASEEEHAEDKK